MNKLCFVLTIQVTLCLVGCKTTGDPNQGGLFGWSENKAKQRQDSLEKKQHQKQYEVTAINSENKSLAQEQQELESSLKWLNQTLHQLREEQDNLREQINRLYSDKKISMDKYKELNSKYNWLTINETNKENSFFNTKDKSHAPQILQKMESENKLVVEEILLLIGR